MKECKYRLPCNWCDRLNKYCDMVEPIKIKFSDTDKCEHDWRFLESRVHTGGTDVYYKCSKCGATKMKYYDVVETLKYEYESGEWQP